MSTPQKQPQKFLQCCVKGCSSKEENICETLFLFPPNMNPRGKRWLELFPHSFVRKPSVDNYICVRHFTVECFNKSGALLHRANPSVNIDTSYAQDMMMKTFIMKVIYEWVLRNSVEAYTLYIWDKVLEAKLLLGIQMFSARTVWTSKFVKFKSATEKQRIRFGSGEKGPKSVLGIVKDIRLELPSNFCLPADNMELEISKENTVKVEDDEDSSLFESEEPADEPVQWKDVIPHKSLDTYQEALELLSPLQDYIKRTGNENASLRLSEIETVVKQALKNDIKPRRSSKRRR